jgi:hypothetical protein
MTDLGLGLLQFRPALNTPAPGDPVLLVLGLQGLSPGTPLPSGSSCLLLVAPVANHLALVGPAPISWTLDGRGLIGPFAFHAQVLHLSAGQLFASEALRVGCQ